MTTGGHLIYALAWLAFGASHSLLASERIKMLLAHLGRWYRLSYNFVALVTIVTVVWLGEHVLFAAENAVVVPGWFEMLRWAVFGFGAILLFAALRGYDVARFSGLQQIREPEAAPDEPLRLDGLHRYMRHPIYLASFMLLWGRAGNEAELATAIWGSVYLIVGMRFEERRLVRLYGAAYRDYQRSVPQVFPWKGRAI